MRDPFWRIIWSDTSLSKPKRAILNLLLVIPRIRKSIKEENFAFKAYEERNKPLDYPKERTNRDIRASDVFPYHHAKINDNLTR